MTIETPADDLLEQIIVHTVRVRDKAKSYGKIFDDNYPNINAFSAIHNGLLLANDLFLYYYNKWLNIEKKPFLDKQDIERVVTIFKWSFIHTFSIIEYSSKELVKKKNYQKFNYVNSLLLNKKRIKFWDIILESKGKEVKIITEQQYYVWDNLRKIRNAITHNNSFADEDIKFECKLENRDFVLETRKGEDIKLNVFLTLGHKSFSL